MDHEARAVVVAVRGTLSLEDCITDVLCEPVGLHGWLPDYLAQVGGGGAPQRCGIKLAGYGAPHVVTYMLCSALICMLTAPSSARKHCQSG